MNDSTITSGEIISSYNEKIKTIQTNFNGKKVTWKTQNFYILIAFLLVAILLLITVSIYCYLIKYQTKYLWPFHCIRNLKKSILII